MKRKYTLLILLILAIFLTGCTGGAVITSADGVKVENTIKEYYLALNDQNWSKAKSYCIYGSELYNEVIELENIVDASPSCNAVLAIYPTILDYGFNDDGLFTCVNCYINDFSTVCGSNINNVQSYNIYLHLQKIGNGWKLYEKHE